MCLYKPSKACINTHKLAKQKEIEIVSPHKPKHMHPKSTQHEPPKPFFIQNGCMRATCITIFHQRFSTQIIHTIRAKRASIYTKREG